MIGKRLPALVLSQDTCIDDGGLVFDLRILCLSLLLVGWLATLLGCLSDFPPS